MEKKFGKGIRQISKNSWRVITRISAIDQRPGQEIGWLKTPHYQLTSLANICKTLHQMTAEHTVFVSAYRMFFSA